MIKTGIPMTSPSPRHIHALFGMLAAALLSTACTTLPLTPVWKPWTRTIGVSGELRPGEYVLRVEGHDSTTVGDGEVMKRQLGGIVEDMLLRHGFSRAEDSAAYLVMLRYRVGTHRYLDWRTEVNNQTTSSTTWETVTRPAADPSTEGGTRKVDTVVVGSTSSAASSSVVHSSTEETRYDFAITLELRDRTRTVLWQGDAMWRSASRDILEEIFQPLKLLVAELPAEPVPTRVRRVREDKYAAFFEQYCAGRIFESPGVPYRVSFRDREDYGSAVRDEYAFQAYVDLLAYAESSVPIPPLGVDYSDVKNPELTRKVMIGGEYLIGDSDDPVPILITLENNDAGSYEVADAHVATGEEYAVFLGRLARWRHALREQDALYE